MDEEERTLLVCELVEEEVKEGGLGNDAGAWVSRHDAFDDWATRMMSVFPPWLSLASVMNKMSSVPAAMSVIQVKVCEPMGMFRTNVDPPGITPFRVKSCERRNGKQRQRALTVNCKGSTAFPLWYCVIRYGLHASNHQDAVSAGFTVLTRIG